MPKLPIKISSLRYITYLIIQELLEEGKYKSEKLALEYILKKKKELTGFSIDFHKAYQQYRTYKYKITKMNTKEIVMNALLTDFIK